MSEVSKGAIRIIQQKKCRKDWWLEQREDPAGRVWPETRDKRPRSVLL